MPQPTHNLVYATVGGRDLHVDVYRPDGAGHRSAVILLHGGGWARGSRATMQPYAEALAADGFLALAGEYRFVGEAPWPAQIEDVQTLVRWARTSAPTLQIDPDKIAIEGFSAGGHLALLAGGLGSDGTPEHGRAGAGVAAVIAFFAPSAIELEPGISGASTATRLLGDGASAVRARQASPLAHVRAGFPPTFLLHGTADTTVAASASTRLHEALTEAGVAVDLHLFHAHAHEFCRLPSMLPLVHAETALFLRRAMVDPDYYEREDRALNPFAAGSTAPPPGTPAASPAG